MSAPSSNRDPATLVVDAGNSRIKWAWAREGALTGRGESEYVAAGVAATLDALWGAHARPAAVFVANVGGRALREAMATWIAEHWAVEPVVVVPQPYAWGVRCAYEDPQPLGADRWVALIAARGRCPAPVCIIDCGTAITLDVLTAGGEHLGGFILPGIGLMRRALSDKAEGIPEVSGGKVSLLGRTTTDCVTGATVYAAVAFIDRVTADVEADLGEPLTCLISGGDAPALRPLLRREMSMEPDLVLEGLALMAGAGG